MLLPGLTQLGHFRCLMKRSSIFAVVQDLQILLRSKPMMTVWMSAAEELGADARLSDFSPVLHQHHGAQPPAGLQKDPCPQGRLKIGGRTVSFELECLHHRIRVLMTLVFFFGI